MFVFFLGLSFFSLPFLLPLFFRLFVFDMRFFFLFSLRVFCFHVSVLRFSFFYSFFRRRLLLLLLFIRFCPIVISRYNSVTREGHRNGHCGFRTTFSLWLSISATRILLYMWYMVAATRIVFFSLSFFSFFSRRTVLSVINPSLKWAWPKRSTGDRLFLTWVFLLGKTPVSLWGVDSLPMDMWSVLFSDSSNHASFLFGWICGVGHKFWHSNCQVLVLLLFANLFLSSSLFPFHPRTFNLNPLRIIHVPVCVS